MPSAPDFKKAFKLNQGVALHSRQPEGRKTILAQVHNSTIGHTAKKRNEVYEFPSTVDVEIKDETTTSRRLEAAVRHFLAGKEDSKERIVYSAYGSPYSCSIKKIKIESFDPEKSHASIKFLGKAVRRRDIPTLGQKKEEERKKQATAAMKRKRKVPTKDIEVSKEDEKKWLLPQLRVIKSRFGSSKCTLCDDIIDPGTKIAKDAHDTQRGGWMHASCAVEQAKSKEQTKETMKQAGVRRKKAPLSPATHKKKRRPSS